MQGVLSFHFRPISSLPLLSLSLSLSLSLMDAFRFLSRIFLTPLLLKKFFSAISSLKKFTSFVRLQDLFLCLYFVYCGLSPCTVDLDDQTSVHIWAPLHRRFDKPSLVLVHGFGGNSRWQWQHQIASLSAAFNLFIPDLVFFGNSVTKSDERSDHFQARCVGEGLKKLGARKFSVVGISYGGFVAYHMATLYEEEIEKVVILSSGICWSEEEKEEILKTVRGLTEILVPEGAEDLRLLMRRSIYRSPTWITLMPAFLLQDFVEVMYKEHRKERQEMLKEMMSKKLDFPVPILNQETLIIWGDRDEVFPLQTAYQIKRHLGVKSRLEVIKDAGHAAQIDNPHLVNDLIKSFILSSS